MRPARFPRKYIPLPIIGALGATLNILRQTDTGIKVLTAEHLAWGGFALLGWFIGMLYADLLNKNSDLLRWWRYRTRLFDVVSLRRYPSHDAQGRQQEQITLCIRFVRRVRDASIHMRVEVPGGSPPKSLDLMTNVSKAKDAELTIVVAVAHIARHPVLIDGEKTHYTSVGFVWGNPEQLSAEHYLPMGGPGKGFATIVIETNGWLFNRQAFAIYADTLGPNAPYFITDEDQELFAAPKSSW